MKLLVVDDELVSRKKLQVILGELGQVDAVTGGAEALRQVQEAGEKGQPYDMVFLDYDMPGMDGLETLKRLRALSASPRVIMVTAFADREVVTSCIQAGCEGYIVKPFQKDTILAKVKAFG